MGQFLEEYSKVLTGKNTGIKNREDVNLNNIESAYDVIEIIFSDDIYSVNTGYFCGFFEPSFKKYKQSFLKKFEFYGREIIVSKIKSDYERYNRIVKYKGESSNE